MLIAFILIITIIILFYIYLTWNFNYWRDKGVIGPKPFVYAGNFGSSSIMKRHIAYDIDDIYRKYKGRAPFIGIFAGRTPRVMALDPEFIKNILIKNFKNFQANEFASLIDKKTDPIFGRNPFMLEGQEWKDKRAEISPAFTTNKLKSTHPIIEDVCMKLNQYIRDKIGKFPNGFNARELSSRFTMEVVTNCIYGIESKSFSEENSEIRQMSAHLFSSFVLMIQTLYPAFPFLKKIIKMRIVPKYIEDFFTQLVMDAIKIRSEQSIERDDFLNYLLELRKRKGLKDIDLTAHTITFFTDGFETSSVLISHILYQLAVNKIVQQKLRDDIQSVMTRDGKLTFENLNEMPYLDQVFNETLRLSPPAFYLSKVCTESFTTDYIKDKEITIEKDTVVMVPIYAIQRDPDYYNNSYRFNPDRFNEENGGLKKYKDMGVFLSFGDGPRTCLGQRFATYQSKASIVEIVKNFNISVNSHTVEPLVIDPKDFFNAPIGGIWLDFEPVVTE